MVRIEEITESDDEYNTESDFKTFTTHSSSSSPSSSSPSSFSSSFSKHNDYLNIPQNERIKIIRDSKILEQMALPLSEPIPRSAHLIQAIGQTILLLLFYGFLEYLIHFRSGRSYSPLIITLLKATIPFLLTSLTAIFFSHKYPRFSNYIFFIIGAISASQMISIILHHGNNAAAVTEYENKVSALASLWILCTMQMNLKAIFILMPCLYAYYKYLQ